MTKALNTMMTSVGAGGVEHDGIVCDDTVQKWRGPRSTHELHGDKRVNDDGLSASDTSAKSSAGPADAEAIFFDADVSRPGRG